MKANFDKQINTFFFITSERIPEPTIGIALGLTRCVYASETATRRKQLIKKLEEEITDFNNDLLDNLQDALKKIWIEARDIITVYLLMIKERML